MAREKEPWFTVAQLAEDTYRISEYRHWEHTHCYLLLGRERALLVDTGLGIGDIAGQVRKLTALPVAAAATHAHWDHIGGHGNLSEFYVHEAEQAWLDGQFPLPLSAVKAMVARDCRLPEDFCLEDYRIFRGKPTRLLCDGDILDLGGRKVQALHTPGHSPGHLCFWEAERGWLFSGDLVYKGTLYANYPSTDPERYGCSLERVAALPVRRLLPGHHDPEVSAELLQQMCMAFRALKAMGKLCHGSGVFSYGDWAVSL